MLPEHREAALMILAAQRDMETRADAMAELVEQGFVNTVTACRTAGMPWADIGHALGMGTSAVRMRYNRGH